MTRPETLYVFCTWLRRRFIDSLMAKNTSCKDFFLSYKSVLSSDKWNTHFWTDCALSSDFCTFGEKDQERSLFSSLGLFFIDT